MRSLPPANQETCRFQGFVSLFRITLAGSKWDSTNKLETLASGLLIRDLAITQVETKAKMRSLALKMSITGRLVGGSSLWIFTRVTGANGELETNKPICIIRKEVET
jgi:hypothetical protein